jgi:hypothetical protein
MSLNKSADTVSSVKQRHVPLETKDETSIF